MTAKAFDLMDGIMIVLEWIGMGLAGLFLLVVVWMIAAIINAGRRDQDWE